MVSETTAPIGQRVRAYFAPVVRGTEVPALFDPAAAFDGDAPPAPWLDLGYTSGFTRRCGTKIEALVAGAPGYAVGQVRTAVEAEVAVEFESWGKVQMALTCGAQQLNVLVGAAVALGAGCTATALEVGAAAGGFLVGDLVAVDVDCAGQTGFVGSGASGAYLKAPVTDADYVRRITLNVQRVASVEGGVLGLVGPLLAGVPEAGMSVCRVLGFSDREGGSFFQEWSGLFVVDGMQGDRVCYFYPRLQSMTGAAEETVALGVLEKVRLLGRFRALSVVDPVDGERVVCFRSYLVG